MSVITGILNAFPLLTLAVIAFVVYFVATRFRRQSQIALVVMFVIWLVADDGYVTAPLLIIGVPLAIMLAATGLVDLITNGPSPKSPWQPAQKPPAETHHYHHVLLDKDGRVIDMSQYTEKNGETHLPNH